VPLLPHGTGAGAGGITAGWEKIAEIDVAADTTTITVTGLDINTDKVYHLLLKVKNPTGSVCDLRIYIENDLTDTNYYSQHHHVHGTACDNVIRNYPEITRVEAGQEAFISLLMVRTPDGEMRFLSMSAMTVTSVFALEVHAGRYVPAIANITRIDIQASVTDSIGAGSKLIIFGVAS